MTIILRTQDCSVIVVYSAHSLSHSFRQLFHIHFLLTLLIHPPLQILSDEDLASPEKQPISDLPKLSLPHVLFHYLSQYTMPSLMFLWMNSAPTHGDLSLVLQISLSHQFQDILHKFLLSLLYQLFFYGWNIPFVIQTCYCNIPLKSKALFLTLYSPPITTQFFYSPLQQKVYTFASPFPFSSELTPIPPQVKVFNDLHNAEYNDQISTLILLYQAVAFDIVDHSTFLKHFPHQAPETLSQFSLTA